MLLNQILVIIFFGDPDDDEVLSDVDVDDDGVLPDVNDEVLPDVDDEESTDIIENKYKSELQAATVPIVGANITEKVKICLKYFILSLIYPSVDLYTSLSNLYINSLLEEIEEVLDEFLDILNNNNAYIAGGYINMAVNYNDLFINKSTDIDIYVKKENIEKFLQDLSYLDNKTFNDINVYNEFMISSPYLESFFKKNGILSRLTKRYVSTRRPVQQIDIIVVDDTKNITDVIKNFDLTYCSVYLDPEDQTVKGDIKAVEDKSGKLNDDYAKHYLFNKFIQNRIKKYKKRGYKTLIDTSINITIDNEKKSKDINDSVIVQKLLNILYNNYKISIPIPQLFNELSVSEYSKDTFEQVCKNIAKIIYGQWDEKYYYYIIIKNCDSLIQSFMGYVITINDYDSDGTPIGRESHTNINKFPEKFKELIEKIKEFKNYYIQKAEENGETQYLKEPIPFVLLFQMLKTDLVKNYIRVITPTFNITDKQIDEKSRKLIDHNADNLLSGVTDEPITELFLLYFKNYILGDMRYVQIILSIINYVSIKEKEKQLIVDWYTNKRFTTAITYNIEQFRNGIIEYTGPIDFSEISYFSPVMYEEIIYEQVHSDDDNLLFVSEDRRIGFTYTFDDMIVDDRQEFILECNELHIGTYFPSINSVKDNGRKWYNMISTQYNIGILTSQLYQAYCLYKNSDKTIRKFVLCKQKTLESVTNLKVLNWGNSRNVNIWNEKIRIENETHCSNSQIVYDEIKYIE